MTAVMRCVRAAPVNLTPSTPVEEPPPKLSKAEKAAAIRLLAARLGVENARRRDREAAAARKAATRCTCHEEDTTMQTPPVPDTYGLTAAAAAKPAKAGTFDPTPPDTYGLAANPAVVAQLKRAARTTAAVRATERNIAAAAEERERSQPAHVRDFCNRVPDPWGAGAA